MNCLKQIKECISLVRELFPFFLVFFCLLPISSAAQTKGQKIDELMSAYHKQGQLEGSVLVAEHGKTIYKKGFGLANREWGIPNSTDTRYDVGSLTKSFTALLIMQLVEEGKLSLEGKLTDYLPDYRKDTGSKITIHHMLSHTSGLSPFWTREFVRRHGRNEFDHDYFIKTFCSSDLEFEPGASSRYSDTNYYLLGRIIEKVTEKTYAQTKEEDLFKPLGMKNSGYYSHEKIILKRASGYVKTRNAYTNSSFNNRGITDAAGASFTTVEDLFLYDRALYKDKVLSKKYRDMLFKTYAPSHLSRRFNMDFGYGWYVGNVPVGESKDSVSVAHAGGNNAGFTAVIYRMPKDKNFIAILTNAGPDFFNEKLHEMCAKIISILYDKSYELPKHSIAEALGATISQNGIAAAIEQYSELKNHDAYSLRERDLNGLGYDLLRRNKIKEAIAIFKINIEAFPQSFNVYDSLAETYMANGDKELAIKNYKKSVELNPNNENAVRQLENLKK